MRSSCDFATPPTRAWSPSTRTTVSAIESIDPAPRTWENAMRLKQGAEAVATFLGACSSRQAAASRQLRTAAEDYGEVARCIAPAIARHGPGSYQDRR